MIIKEKKVYFISFFIFFFFLTLTLGAVSAFEKRLFTAEDLLKLKRLSDPQISPSGEWVAFVVSQFEPDRNLNSEVWIVAKDGSRLVQITHNPGPDSHPRWSPDGKTLAFLSRQTKDKFSQIYFYILKEKKIKKITFQEANIRDFKWSPDGKAIAFLMAKPLTSAERERLAKGDDAQVVDQDYRHIHLWIFSLRDRKARLLTSQEETVWSFNWSPDSRKIAMLASPLPTAEGHEYRSKLVLVDLKGGQEKVLAEKTNAQAAPCFSSDGRWLAYLAPVDSFKERGIIKIISLKGGLPLELLKDYEGNVWDIAWQPGTNKILAGLACGTSNHLSIVNLQGKVKDLVQMEHTLIPYWGNYWTVSSDGQWLAFLNEKARSPREIWISRLNGLDKKQLTDFNNYLQQVKLGKVEEVEWTNPKDNSGVDGILVKPANFQDGKAYPLIVWFHGGPAYNWALGSHISNWAQLFASQGYLVFLPNFRGSSGHGMNWMMANVGDWGQGPMSDVMSGIDYLINKGLVDKDRLFVGGSSYGGYLTSWVITQTDRFKAAFVSAGVTDLLTEYALTDEPSFLLGYFNSSPYDNPEIYRKNSPLTYASRVKTPVLIVHGERDLRVPVSQAFEFYSALKHYGAEVTLVVYPREYHGLREYSHQLDLLKRILKWFNKYK